MDSQSERKLFETAAKQLSDLKAKNINFYELHSEMLNLESRFNFLTEEKNRNSINFQKKAELNSRQISNLKAEIDSLKNQISQIKFEYEELLINNDNLKAILDKKKNDYSKIKEENQKLKIENLNIDKKLDSLEKENESLETSIKSNQKKLEELKIAKNESEKQVEALDQRIRFLNEKMRIMERTKSENQNKLDLSQYNLKKLNEMCEQKNNDYKQMHKHFLCLQSDLKFIEDASKTNLFQIKKNEAEGQAQEEKNGKNQQELEDNKNVLKELDEKIYELKRKKENNALIWHSAINDENKLLNEIQNVIHHINEENMSIEELKKLTRAINEDDKIIYNVLDKKRRINQFFERNLFSEKITEIYKK